MMPSRALIAFLLCLATPLAGDVITKSNGDVLRGEVVEQSDTRIRVHIGNGILMSLSPDEVAHIKKEPLAETLLLIADRELSRNHLTRAARTLERALKADPDHVKVRHALATVRIRQAAASLEKRRPAAALTNLDQARELMPKDEQVARFHSRTKDIIAKLDVLEKKGLTAHSRGEWFEAQRSFRQLLDQDASRQPKVRKPFAEALVNLGDKALLKKEHGAAAEYYDEALELDPDLIGWIESRWVTAHLEPILDLINDKHYEAALDEIRVVLQVVPNNVNALYFRGVTRFNMGERDLAAGDFERILRNENVDEIPEDTKKLQQAAKKRFKTKFNLVKLDDMQARWAKATPGDAKVLKGHGWEIHHHNDWIADQLKYAVDDALAEIYKKLGGYRKVPLMKPVTKIIIYPTKKEYGRFSGMPDWTGGVAQTLRENNKVVKRRILSYQTSPQLVRSIIPHELVHIVVPELVGRGGLPKWLEEGLAVTFEPDYKKKYYRGVVAQHTARGTRPSLEDFFASNSYPESEEDVRLFYAMSFVIVEHLLDKKGGLAVIDWAKGVTPENDAEKLADWMGELEALEVSLFGK